MEKVTLQPATQEIEKSNTNTVQDLGKVTVLEALAVETNAISVDRSHRSTRDGTGVDFEDD